jgi:cardiolipin synthase
MPSNFFHITKGNHVEFFRDGLSFQDEYIALIDNAQKSIHLQTYIFELDNFGSRVCNSLIEAAKRGVHVYLLIESVGSRTFSELAEEKLKSAGVYFKRFNALHIKILYRWGRRLHHKVLLVDHTKCFIGGINVYDALKHDTPIPQLDFAVYIEGTVTVDIANYCRLVFKKAYRKELHYEHITENNKKELFHPTGFDVGISINDWVHRRWKISRQYSKMTSLAQKELTIINSYFFPRKKFMDQLVKLAKRGVRVRLVLPKYSDWPSYVYASEYMYDFFIKNGIEVYLWKDSILHGKLATVDDVWSTIGSFNLNYTSYQQNMEMNVDVYSREFTTSVKSEIENIIALGCVKIEPKYYLEKATFKIRIRRLFYFAFFSVLSNFAIGLTFQEEPVAGNKFLHILRFTFSLFFFILGCIGAIVPIMPGIPFFVISFMLVYRQILLNNKTLNKV